MTIDLSDFEDGRKYEGDYAADLLALQERLARIQVAHIVHGRSAIIAIEGWDASGKGGAISRLTSPWDPRWFEVWPIGAPTEEERVRHFLWRFWKRLPGKGEINIFDRTWYGRVLVERVEGFCSEAEWKRAYDEINEFEAQQKDNGVTLIKLFMHVTQDEQDKRLKERLEDPWKRWKTGAEDYRNRARRADYLKAYHDMFARTDTRWAPWSVIDGNNKKAARIAALTTIADTLERNVAMKPLVADPELVKLAEAALGQQIRFQSEGRDPE
ncbi:polyphosphate kinase 2 family protein [Aquisediminimonas profunda]|uniref:polyphosphate kinase 2 family protein n=1 Tax=Aquisediminimonas profunda TaxID=1550733 RepID=UPI001C6377EF|nr:polyphosphate kinase [Aquisediminimonas profunda]